MHYTWVGIATLLLASSASAISKPSPSSLETECNDSAVPSQILSECLASGHLEGSIGLQQCLCASQGNSYTTVCSGSSPSAREAPSIYSTGLVTEERNFDGDPKTQAIVTVPPTNHKHTLHNAAAADIYGKGGVDITRLSGSKQELSQRQRQRRRKTLSPAKQQPASTNDMSTIRKIVGGIALGVLVMVV
ncbi:hypothetical protein BGX38DRAFT_1156596 [Terfezia claveryi]|nr:hypothetical protein BGX38DRAFT_1242081 [Terfezia claveryi]KAF8457665.1 hypothetical protein BGX38DRAFT_1156596 [Terfezia claveryi]